MAHRLAKEAGVRVPKSFRFRGEQEAIDGFEVGCAVLGNEVLTAGAVDEIELSEGFFDYTEKYTLKTSKIHVPARISKEKAEEIHETGLAIDVGKELEEVDFICPEFPYEGVCQIFRELAPMYGFIERYPKGKEAVTGIAKEPWHFRYVGYPHARIIQNLGMTLEEYHAFIPIRWCPLVKRQIFLRFMCWPGLLLCGNSEKGKGPATVWPFSRRKLPVLQWYLLDMRMEFPGPFPMEKAQY